MDFWWFHGSPGPPQAPTNTYKSTRHIRPLKKTHMSWERKVQRRVQRGACRETNLEHLTRLGRLRARSGYIWAKGGPGLPAKWGKVLRILGTRPPDNAIRVPFSGFRCPFSGFRAPFFDLQAPFAGFWYPFSDFWLHCPVPGTLFCLSAWIWHRYSS